MKYELYLLPTCRSWSSCSQPGVALDHDSAVEEAHKCSHSPTLTKLTKCA